MSEQKHTPGPWLVNPFCAQVDDAQGVPICQLLWPTDERTERETMENAKLIQAAPDMLAALIETRQEISCYLDWARHNGRTNSELQRIGKGLDSVIRKAKGEA